ncbi:hypothetical protein PYW07_013548 [Mythimna separata]|uniref:Pre-C2HC domain-containing protein n=1 Tax=Mythimna separata TaxID=271217 RepID=A0AAD7YAM9_MYTSE|nr:hypothetical protein PYW07_013548 [Mythimna separata]
MTTLKSGHIVKIMPTDIDTYKIIRENFTTNNISHYTYKLKSERPYRVVLRGLHSSQDIDDIKHALNEIGHEVRQIVNVKHRETKEPLPLFYVDLEPKTNNKDIFKVEKLDYMKVTFEAPYRKKEVLQCKRCQRFGHTKNQCCRPYRCVKCGETHPSNECAKPSDTEATCANCQEKHPSSYKGCQKYKQYRELILKPKQKSGTKTTQKSTERKQEIPINNKNQQGINQQKTSTRTYADITKNRDYPKIRPENSYYSNNPDNIVNVLDTMFDRFQNIMSNMLDNMMDRMIQLITQIIQKCP